MKRLRDMLRLADVRLPRPLGSVVARLASIPVPRPLKSTLGVRITGAALCTAGLSFIGFGTLGAPTVFGPIALSASGDVFVDTVNPPNNNGNEHDPHLPCEDIFIFGDKLANASGDFVITDIPPTAQGGGSQVAWTAGWLYDTTTGGVQDIIAPGPSSTVSVATLLANAAANGDSAQAQQGFHFSLDVTDGSTKKSKTFWVDCSHSTTTTTATVTVASPTSTTTTTTTGTTTTTTGTGTITTTTAPGSTTTTTAPATTTTLTNATTVTTTETTTVPTTVTETTATVSVGTVTRTVTVPVTVTRTRTVTTANNGTVTKTVTHATTVAAPTTKTQTKTVTTGSPASSTSSSSPSSSTSTSSSTSSTKAGVQGATTPTPPTGADLEFGGGLVLLVIGSGLVAFARRITGNKDE